MPPLVASEIIFYFTVIRKEQAVLVCGIPATGDHLISRLEAAPTGVLYGNLNFLDNRLSFFFAGSIFIGLFRQAGKFLSSLVFKSDEAEAYQLTNL